MGEELTQQVEAGTGAAQQEASTVPAASSEPTTEATPAPDMEAQIDAAVQEAIKAYEGKGGHLAQLRSSKDKEIAALKKQLRQQQQSKVEEAKKLIEENPGQAAEILLHLAEEQTQQIEQDSAQEQLVDWQHRILTDLGVDPDEDEEAAALVSEWAEKMLEDPNLTWDFQQAAAQLQIGRKDKALKETTKELKELKDGLDDMVSAAVTRHLVSAGIIAEPSPDGTAPPKDDQWRENPSVARGLAKRRKQPIQRT